MLRIAVLLLLLANAGYYAWSQGMLHDWGLAPAVTGEPERLAQQIAPQRLQLVTPATKAAPTAVVAPAPAAPAPIAPPSPAPNPAPTVAAAPAPAAAPTTPPAPPGVCLESGILDTHQADAVRSAATRLPQDSWSLESTPLPGRWMVYMGRFADGDALARKRQELRDLKIDTDRPGASFEPGLSLGRFSTEEAAQRGLSDLTRKGVRTARVVQERSDANGFVLRLPSVTAALRPSLKSVQAALGKKELRPCD